jgi:ribosomal protein L11 methyltransferase
VLDVGTGSGVLAVVALRLGAAFVLATDIDPLAVRVAHENAALNAVATGAGTALEIRQGSVPAANAKGFQVVVANILAEVLAKLFDGAYDNTPLAEPLAPGGHIILSGILADRAPLVEAAAQRQGLTLTGRLEEGDWVALIARK